MTANFQIVPDNNISIIVDILHPSVDAYSKKKKQYNASHIYQCILHFKIGKLLIKFFLRFVNCHCH